MAIGKGINVHSEIGKLRRVVLHRPGLELTTFKMEEFDKVFCHEVYYMDVMQAEHDVFAQHLRDEGAEVLYIEDLAAEAIATSREARQEFIDGYIAQAGIRDDWLREQCRSVLDRIANPRDLVEFSLGGIHFGDLDLANRPKSLYELDEGKLDPSDLLVLPVPNMFFTRDPIATVGRGVNINRMLREPRDHEVLYYEMVFKYHPDYKDVPQWRTHDVPFFTEGGDVLNINEHTVAIGISERTESAAIDIMARNMFWKLDDAEIDTIYAFKIPAEIHSFMHLDTVFTQIDYDKFTYHPAVMSSNRVYKLAKGAKPGEVSIKEIDGSLEEIIKQMCGLSAVKLIPCGGGDPILASREQWNDGANTLCVAPGTVCVYDRNVITNDVLYKEGLKLLVVPSEELSHGRGGPRCMSMPFWRDEI